MFESLLIGAVAVTAVINLPPLILEWDEREAVATITIDKPKIVVQPEVSNKLEVPQELYGNK